MGKFGSVQLGNMVAVGTVADRSARLWFRSEIAGPHELRIWPLGAPAAERVIRLQVDADSAADNTISVLYPDDVPGEPPLSPLQRYQFKVTRSADGTPLGEGRFETAPARDDATPSRYAFALMSCHQPFTSDGDLSERSMRMLRLAPRVLSDYDAKFVLMCGDQIYADTPGDFSLLNPHYYSTKVNPARQSILDASAAEVRQAYQQRYRIFWAMNEMRHIQANYPCYPMLDDHEIADDWGSLSAHATRRFANLARGARQAYADYQGSRVGALAEPLPRNFHYSFQWGSLALFALDIRSERRVRRAQDNVVYGRAQHNALRRFLRANRHKRVVLVLTSVPVVHLPSWLADIGHSISGHAVDFADHWSFDKNRPARDRLLTLLHEHQQRHPGQRLALVGGDAHIGCAFAIHWRGGAKPLLYQFTASAISNRLKASTAYFSGLGPRLVSSLRCGDDGPSARVNLIEGNGGDNPFGGLNLGILEVRERGDHATVNFKLVGYPPDDQWEHHTIYETGEL